jgi:hypothetical protein
MSMLILLVFLLGAILGMRFKVLILIPVIAFALIAILVGGVTRGDSVSAILFAIALVSIGLQLGYLTGIATRYTIALARAGRLRKSPVQARPARTS